MSYSKNSLNYLNEALKNNENLSASSKRHEKNLLTARERLMLLLDKDSFHEYDAFVQHQCTNFGMQNKKTNGDGVITGYGTIYSRLVFVYSQDFTKIGGSLGLAHARKISKVQKAAMQAGVPIIGIQDSGGARIQEGIDALAGYGEIFQNNIHASGLIPQISIILGPSAGGAAYSPALTDFVFMSKSSGKMFITGPDVVKAVTGEEISMNKLGGSSIHSKKSGVCHVEEDNDYETIMSVRRLLSFLPSSCNKSVPRVQNHDPISRSDIFFDSFIPNDEAKPYNMKSVIKSTVDFGETFEIHANFAKNIITSFARMDGETVGIVANQPMFKAGCIDINSSRKAARFIRFCDAFNIPIISIIDVPGFLPGVDQEHNGIINHGAKLLYAYGEATVPKISLITRKSYGGAYIVMGSKHLNADINLSWPSAQIAVMGAKPATEVLYKKDIKNGLTIQEQQDKINEYNDMFCNPYIAAARGYIDDVIKPRDTRKKIISSLRVLKNKQSMIKIQKKHDNLPL